MSCLRRMNEHRPGHVLVCGRTTWNNLPEQDDCSKGSDINAYRLADGSYAICLAVRHPSRSRWTEVRKAILKLKSYAVRDGRLETANAAQDNA